MFPRASRRVLGDGRQILLRRLRGEHRRADPLALEPSLGDAPRDDHLGSIRRSRASSRQTSFACHQRAGVRALQGVRREGFRGDGVSYAFRRGVHAVNLAAFHQRVDEGAYGPDVHRVGLREFPFLQVQLVHLAGHVGVFGDERLVFVEDLERGSHLVRDLAFHAFVLRGGLLGGPRELLVDERAHVRLGLLDLARVLVSHRRRLEFELGVDVVDPS